MTDTELSAIRARCEAATPGPWYIVTDINRKHDSSFCARARTDIPALLERIDEQRVTLAKAEADKAGLVEALEKLARLGNGDKYGNSDGNCIAQAALARIKAQS